MAWPFDGSDFSSELASLTKNYNSQSLNDTSSFSDQLSFNPTTATSDNSSFSFSDLFGSNDATAAASTTGSGFSTGLNTGLSALQAISSAWLGSKQLSLAQDTFDESVRQFDQNFGASVSEYNTDISDRQDRRYSGAGGDVASNIYATTDEYMAENKLES